MLSKNVMELSKSEMSLLVLIGKHSFYISISPVW